MEPKKLTRSKDFCFLPPEESRIDSSLVGFGRRLTLSSRGRHWRHVSYNQRLSFSPAWTERAAVGRGGRVVPQTFRCLCCKKKQRPCGKKAAMTWSNRIVHFKDNIISLLSFWTVRSRVDWLKELDAVFPPGDCGSSRVCALERTNCVLVSVEEKWICLVSMEEDPICLLMEWWLSFGYRFSIRPYFPTRLTLGVSRNVWPV